MGRTVLRPKEPKPNEKILTGRRPNNCQCGRCNEWLHKDYLVAHLHNDHGMSVQEAQLAAANNGRNSRSQTAASRPQTMAKKPAPSKRGGSVPRYEAQSRIEAALMSSLPGSRGKAILRVCPICKARVKESRLKKHCFHVHRVTVGQWNDYEAGSLPIIGTELQRPKTIAPRAPKKRKSTGRNTSKKAKKIDTKLAKDRKKMKELFRDIDAWNFPRGAQLTSNSSGRIGRGGGFMSNRRKY